MGFRTKDEVIYSRVTGSTRREFHKQMEESGYKSSSDFIEYLLRVNKGKQVDGVTLKKFMDKMKDVVYEHFGIWKNLIKMWKTEYWNYWRRWRNGRSIWKCECKIQSL